MMIFPLLDVRVTTSMNEKKLTQSQHLSGKLRAGVFIVFG